MEAKDVVKKAYEAFGKGDMETMFTDFTWKGPSTLIVN